MRNFRKPSSGFNISGRNSQLMGYNSQAKMQSMSQGRRVAGGKVSTVAAPKRGGTLKSHSSHRQGKATVTTVRRGMRGY